MSAKVCGSNLKYIHLFNKKGPNNVMENINMLILVY